jgi:hypothetical protein
LVAACYYVTITNQQFLCPETTFPHQIICHQIAG